MNSILGHPDFPEFERILREKAASIDDRCGLQDNDVISEIKFAPVRYDQFWLNYSVPSEGGSRPLDGDGFCAVFRDFSLPDEAANALSEKASGTLRALWDRQACDAFFDAAMEDPAFRGAAGRDMPDLRRPSWGDADAMRRAADRIGEFIDAHPELADAFQQMMDRESPVLHLNMGFGVSEGRFAVFSHLVFRPADYMRNCLDFRNAPLAFRELDHVPDPREFAKEIDAIARESFPAMAEKPKAAPKPSTHPGLIP